MAALIHHSSKPFVLLAFVLIFFTQICSGEDRSISYNDDTIEKGTEFLKYGNYMLKFENDCSLKLYDAGKVVWTSNEPIEGEEFCYCWFNWFGNLEIYAGFGQAKWSALNRQPQAGQYVLILQKNRDLAIYGPPIWSSPTEALFHSEPANDEKSVLYSGESLKPGDSLVYGRYSLKMQSDCNLAMYDGRRMIWNSYTAGLGDKCICKFQEDGNLVVYDDDNKAVWSSKTNHHDEGHYVLVLQKDRKLVIYDKALWESGSAVANAMRAPNAVNSKTDAISRALKIATVV